MASAYLTRTVTASTATSYTVSFWVKINDVGNTSTPYLWSIGSTAGNGIYFDSDFKIDFFKQSTTSYLTLYDGVLRDPSAWYHIVWSVNAGTGTAYVNGITGNSHSSIPALNDNSGTKINIHAYVTGAYNTLDCCMAHFHFIDGTAYSPTDFAETDSTTGIWKPKASPSVTYGTNGFFLKFENSGSMGTDSSGNANNFTVSGTLTQTVDTPSNNFATMNPLYPMSDRTLSNGNTTLAGGSATNWTPVYSTLGVSKGKWYFESKYVSGTYMLVGASYNPIITAATSSHIAGNAEGYGYWNDDGNKYNNNSGSAYGDSYTTGDIVGVALDLDNNYIYFSKNGVWQNSGDPTSGATGTGAAYSVTSGQTYFLGTSTKNGNSDINYGNGYFGTSAVASAGTNASGIGTFEYDVPSGYVALCTKNINTYG